MRDTVDLDEMGAELLRRDNAVRTRPNGQSAPLPGRLRHLHVERAPIYLNSIGLRPEAQHLQLVGRTEVAEREVVSDCDPDFRAAAGRGG